MSWQKPAKLGVKNCGPKLTPRKRKPAINTNAIYWKYPTTKLV